MKTKLFFLSLLFCTHSAFGSLQISLPKKWQKLQEKQDVVVFKDSSSPKNILTIAWTETEVANINEKNFKDEIQKMQISRSRVNQFIGLEKWKIDKSSFEATHSLKILSLEGSYSKDGHEYRFWEKINFKDKKYAHIKLEAPVESAPTTKEITEIFATVKI